MTFKDYWNLYHKDKEKLSCSLEYHETLRDFAKEFWFAGQGAYHEEYRYILEPCTCQSGKM